MLEWLAVLMGGSIGAERIIDYVVRKKKANEEIVRKAARAAFDIVYIVLGDDKARAETLFLNRVEAGLSAAGLDPSKRYTQIAQIVFEELWAARKNGHWDTALAELKSSGSKALKAGESLASQAVKDAVKGIFP